MVWMVLDEDIEGILPKDVTGGVILDVDSFSNSRSHLGTAA